LAQAFLDRRVKMMVVRTIAIDDALRAVRSPQVVILGAGLDGRAWRMDELRDAIVYEVDHPDTQREKRARVPSLTQLARDVRFVPVDFTRDALDDALAAAGHDPTQPTTWIWEGVIMYLSPPEVESTLAVIGSRSCAGSRLIALYHAPFWLRHLVGIVVRRLGEPLRSTFTAQAMAALIARHGFRVTSDRDLPEIAQDLSRELAQATRVTKHSRIVVADELDGAGATHAR
jgi:methyltransferase (TIGR00027 family)